MLVSREKNIFAAERTNLLLSVLKRKKGSFSVIKITMALSQGVLCQLLLKEANKEKTSAIYEIVISSIIRINHTLQEIN